MALLLHWHSLFLSPNLLIKSNIQTISGTRETEILGTKVNKNERKKQEEKWVSNAEHLLCAKADATVISCFLWTFTAPPLGLLLHKKRGSSEVRQWPCACGQLRVTVIPKLLIVSISKDRQITWETGKRKVSLNKCWRNWIRREDFEGMAWKLSKSHLITCDIRNLLMETEV